jgi:hypothetical protein
MKGAIVQDEGGGKGDMQTTDMPTQTATCSLGDIQADSRTGAAGHTHMGTREEAGLHCRVELKGWDRKLDEGGTKWKPTVTGDGKGD